jgi:hypothetical protein
MRGMDMLWLSQILILADESLEDSVVKADSRSLATLLLIRDIQVRTDTTSQSENDNCLMLSQALSQFCSLMG